MGNPKHFVSPEVADMIADDLPDGAYYAMMEELTGMDGVEAILSLCEDGLLMPPKNPRDHACPYCGKMFRGFQGLRDHTKAKHEATK